jgi:hypothetical protein
MSKARCSQESWANMEALLGTEILALMSMASACVHHLSIHTGLLHEIPRVM